MSETGKSRVSVMAAAPILVEVLVNVALPYLIYMRLHAAYGDVRALLASSAPPIVWSIVEFARKRRVDAVSIMVVAGIVLSLLAFIGGGGAKFLQLRENLVGGLVALAFLGSAAIGKPLMYELARAGIARKSESEAGEFVALKDHPMFRRSMTVMTLVWGIGLLAQTIAACILVYSVPIPTYLLVSPVMGYGTIGALALWTWLYARHRRARRVREEGSK